VTRHPYVVCDVFTDEPLQGNQLAVFREGRAVPEPLLQPLAKEMNFSETVFVYPPDGDGDFRVRIFSPVAELPFAGHPVLGTAIVLGSDRQGDAIRLGTGRGVIDFAFQREGQAIKFAWMRQPVPTWEPYEHADALLEFLGLTKTALPIDVYDNGVRHLFVGLESEDAVAKLKPDFPVLAQMLPDIGLNCFAGSATRYKTRMFGPGLGVAEDPATGSAAGPLAVHLARYERIAFDTEIEIRQGLEIGRPSTLYARVGGSADRVTSVEVGGSAVIVAHGEFSLP
jgi:trans-2,3-dihydro-3-hydroxyanthranilate isomerase